MLLKKGSAKSYACEGTTPGTSTGCAAGKHLEVLAGHPFKGPCGKKSNTILCCSEACIGSRAMEVALPLYSAPKVLFRPPQHSTAAFTMDSLKQVLYRL